MIELSAVRFTYPSGIEALAEVLLRVERGEFVVLCALRGAARARC